MVSLALDKMENSATPKFIQTHYISLPHLLPAQIPRVHKAKFDEERPFMGYSYVREHYTQQNLCVGVLSFYIINIPCYIRSNDEGIESVAEKNRTGYHVLSDHVCP